MVLPTMFRNSTIEFENRSGNSDKPFGYVYFEVGNYLGQDVRMGYIGGTASKPDDTSAHPTERYAPYVFTANWGEPTYYHIIAAWEFLVEEGVAGFVESHLADSDVIRWMNGGDWIPSSRMILEKIAERERKQAMRRARAAQLRPNTEGTSTTR